MLKWFKIALRNIIKNKRRSFVTILAIAIGFAAISLFRGYTDNTYEGLRQSAIRGEGLAHLTIYKKGWLENGKKDPETHMFTQAEIKKITQIVEQYDDVILATPQIFISGLVSNGKNSQIFIANGVVAGDEKIIRGAWEAFRPVNGKRVDDNVPYGVEMAGQLAADLDLESGDDAVIMGTTLSGQMNALDINIAGTFDTGTTATNDKYIRIPFSYAQSLYDTGQAERIVVLLSEWQKTGKMKSVLDKVLAENDIHCVIKTWNELSVFFTQVKNMFDLIFVFIFSIVLVIVVMSVINTMSMTVVERTREIGTMRALGLKRRGVTFLFAIEGMVLGFIGAVFGTFLNVIVWTAIRYAQPSYIPPGSSLPVPLTVNLVPGAMVVLMMFLVLLSLFSAIIPARKASKQNIVDTLGFV